MVNASLALCATDREIAARRAFVEEAKRGLEVCKGLHRPGNPEDKIILLEDTIEDAAKEVDVAEFEEEESGEEDEDEHEDGEEGTAETVNSYISWIGIWITADVLKVVGEVQSSNVAAPEDNNTTTVDEAVVGPLPVSSHGKPADV
jgi:hypothetical protein